MELCDHMEKSPLPMACESFIRNPTSLIGRQVKQRFLEDGNSTWYSGTVKDYSPQAKTHCIVYEGDCEEYYFDLTLDFLLGDLLIV